MYNGYDFYFKDGTDVLTFPITPSELTIKIGSNNKVVNLISGGDINILKSPSLVEIEFDARFPMRQYPYARNYSNFKNYWDKFKELKEKKKSFRFIVARATPNGINTWDTNLLVALESMELSESADNGDDVLITFKLKQYREYGIIKLPDSYLTKTNSGSNSTSTSSTNRSNDGKDTKSSVYTVKSGDCLWNIAKAAYGDGSKHKKIYDANKAAIEDDAKKHGKNSSSNGHWIYPGLKLTIPEIDNADSLNVKKLW